MFEIYEKSPTGKKQDVLMKKNKTKNKAKQSKANH